MSGPSQGDGVIVSDDGNFTLHFLSFYFFCELIFI